MLRRPPKAKPPKHRPLFSDPLFLGAYADALEIHDPDTIGGDYHDWLYRKGFDPVTGRMTEQGLALFKQLLDHRRESNCGG